MARPPNHPLPALSDEEREGLRAISRSFNDPAAHVARAKALLAVAGGASFTEAVAGPAGAVAMPSPPWWLGSTSLVWPRWRRSTGAALLRPTPTWSVVGFCRRWSAVLIGRPMTLRGAAQGCGRFARGEHLHDLDGAA